MPETIEGKLSAGKFRFAIVSSRVNSFVTNPMTEGAIDTLVRHGASGRAIDVIKVPGFFRGASGGEESGPVRKIRRCRGDRSHNKGTDFPF